MKKCPMCNASTTDDATMCYECLYSFELMSCAAMAPGADEEPADDVGTPVAAPCDTSAPPGAAADWELVVTDPELGERVFSLESGSLHVGRLPTNEIVLNDPTVSRRHLHFFVEGGDVWAEDFGSTNPSVLNGSRFSGRVRLSTGDVVRVRSATIALRRLGDS